MGFYCRRKLGEVVILFVETVHGTKEIRITMDDIRGDNAKNKKATMLIEADQDVHILREELISDSNKPRLDARIRASGEGSATDGGLSDGRTPELSGGGS